MFVLASSICSVASVKSMRINTTELRAITCDDVLMMPSLQCNARSNRTRGVGIPDIEQSRLEELEIKSQMIKTCSNIVKAKFVKTLMLKSYFEIAEIVKF